MLGSLENLESRLCLLKCLRVDLVGTAAPEVLQGSCGLCQEKKERKVFHSRVRITLDLPAVMPWPHSALGDHL